MIYLNRQLPYLVDPRSGADLVQAEDGIAPVDNPQNIYQIQDGILRLNVQDLYEQSTAYDSAFIQRGIPIPDEHAFRALPRTALPGWDDHFWQQRALSMAAVWHVLEARRRASGKASVGFQGAAADLTSGLPYMAYGLDSGGFITFAVSPHVGRFALGVHPHSRYCRIQANWEALPLKPGLFDVVIFSGSVPDIPTERLPEVLKQAARLLNNGGHLFITDTPAPTADLLNAAGLQVKTHPVRGMSDSLNGRLKHLIGKGIPAPPLVIATNP